MPTGNADLTLQLNSTMLPPINVSIVPASIGIFTNSSFGGPAVAQNVSGLGTVERNALTTPALPGQYVTLWGTGLGGFRAPDISMSIGGRVISPSFAGPAQGLPGVDQINFRVPYDSPWGCYIPVRVAAGDSVANVSTIAVSPTSGTCVHPLGLFDQEMKVLDQGGSILAGNLRFNAGVSSPTFSTGSYTRQESFTATFLTQNSFGIYALSPSAQSQTESSCSLRTLLLGIGILVNVNTSSLEDVAGHSLSLADSSNHTSDVPSLATSGGFGGGTPTAQGIYSLTLESPPPAATESQLGAPFFTPGTWYITASGGNTINAFQQAYSLPPEIRWTNRESLTSFGRDADVPILWDPQGYAPTDRMLAFLFTGGDANEIFCSAPAQSGRIVLPANLLQQIAPTARLGASFQPTGSLELVLEPGASTVFRVDLKGGGSAPNVITYVFSDVLQTVVQ